MSNDYVQVLSFSQRVGSSPSFDRVSRLIPSVMDFTINSFLNGLHDRVWSEEVGVVYCFCLSKVLQTKHRINILVRLILSIAD